MNPEIKYISQQGEADCGVATIAMVGGITYKAALRSLTKLARDNIAAGVGIDHCDLERALRKHGFVAFLSIFEHYAAGEKKRRTWPPDPMGWRHIVSSQNADGTHHFSAMDWRGRVFDPSCSAVCDLTEFHRVNEVTIVVRPTALFDVIGHD